MQRNIIVTNASNPCYTCSVSNYYNPNLVYSQKQPDYPPPPYAPPLPPQTDSLANATVNNGDVQPVISESTFKSLNQMNIK